MDGGDAGLADRKVKARTTEKRSQKPMWQRYEETKD